MREDATPEGHGSLVGRERIATLASYVPQAVLRRLASRAAITGATHVDRYPTAVLLIDITGFTAFVAAASQVGGDGIERYPGR